MVSNALQDAINDQIRKEFYSAYLYLAMSAHFTASNLVGSASWVRLQAQEELGHAMKLYDYMNERGARVVLQSVDQPPSQFGSPLEVFQQVLHHEQEVTASINRLYELAVRENDYPTQVELQWFVKEQVEEEQSASLIVEQMKLVAGQPAGLFMIDSQLARRGAGG